MESIASQAWGVKEIHSQSLGSFQLGHEDLKQLPQEIYEGLQQVYSKALNSPSGRALLGSPGKDPTRFAFDFSGEDGLYLTAKGKRVRICSPQKFLAGSSSSWDPIKKTHAYVQRKNLNTIESVIQRERSERIGKIFDQAKKERTNLVHAALPQSLKDRIIIDLPQKLSVFSDVLSLIRNSLSIKAVKPKSSIYLTDLSQKVEKFIGGSGILAGAVSILLGGCITYDAVLDAINAVKHGDGEGKVLAALSGVSGINYSLLGTGMMIENTHVLAHAVYSTAAASLLLTTAGFAMYGALGAASLVEIAISGSFRAELNEILSNEDISETDRLREALIWMRQQVTLSDFEEMQIREQAKKEGKAPEKELERALQRKWDRFERRTSPDACHLIREEVTPEFLERLKSKEAKAIVKARSIIDEVSQANFKRLVKNVLLMIIVILGITAFAGAVLFSGPLSPALFALGAALWILIDWTYVHDKFADLVWTSRNVLWPEWSHRLKGRVCPKQSPTSWTTSALKRIYRPTRSMPTSETSRPFRPSSRVALGVTWMPNRFLGSSPA